MTLVTLGALSIMAAYTLMRVTPNIHIAHQNAAWQEARLTAEAGIDAAMNDLNLNATGFAPGEWTGWQEEVVPVDAGVPAALKKNSLKIISGLGINRLTAMLAKNKGKKKKGSLPLPPEPLVQTRELFLDNVRISSAKSMPSEVDIQLWGLHRASDPEIRWYRIRAMGTSALPPTAYNPPAALDVPLRRFSLKQVRPSLAKDDVGNATTVPLPNVSRVVEVLVEPILAFELALWTSERVELPNVGAWDVDSFDSSDTTKSGPGGLYPGRGSPLVQANGNIASSSPPSDDPFAPPAITANGTRIHGAVSTDGGDDRATQAHENVAGASGIDPNRIHDEFAREMIPLIRPDGEFLLSPAGGQFVAGPEDAPTIYSVHGDLRDVHLSAPAPLANAAVVILIDGNLDLLGPLTVPPSVTAVLYVRGSITFRGSVNADPASSNRAAQLLIFGDGARPQTQSLRVFGSVPVYAAFYGPQTDVTLDGDVNWMGSLNAHSFRVATAGKGGLHYDEALTLLGPTVGFRIVRYIEDIRE